MRLPLGTRIGPYEIIDMLGSGGMGEVYRAQDIRLGRAVAIKVLPDSVGEDSVRLARFEQEARTVAALNHPNILALFDVGESGGMPYLVSELLEGRTLRDRLHDGALPLRSAIDFACQIANGLSAAHEKGIVHRDLKPENIFLTRDGHVKVLDFGLAKLARAYSPSVGVASSNARTVGARTSPGVVMGTIGYMSPEQVLGFEVNQCSDLFSFGTMLYEMLSGQSPFQRDNSVEMMNAILKEDPPEFIENLHIPPGLQRIVRRCLEKNAEHRFQSAKDLAFALEALSGPMTSVQRSPRFPVRLPYVLIVSALLAVVAVAASRWSLRSTTNHPPRFKQVTFRRGSLQAARFAPDGVSIIYSAQWEGGSPQVLTGRLGEIDFRPLGLPSGTVAAISHTGEIAMLLGCEPFFVSDCGGTLAKVPSAGGAPRQLLEHVHYADWSPDGTELAVVVQDPNGHNRLEYPIGHVLYETSGYISTPRISPDGKLIAFANHRLPNDDRGDVTVVDREGHLRTLAAELASVEGLAWLPSGKALLFAASGPLTEIKSSWADTIFSADLSGKLRRILHLPSITRLHDISQDGRVLVSVESWRHQITGFFPGDHSEHPYSWFDWSVVMGTGLSPDGKTLLFTEAGAAATDDFVPYLRPTDGSPAVRLGGGGAIALSPGGKWAAVNDLNTNQLSLIPTGAGRARDLDKGPIQQYDFPGWWSGDGKIISFAAQEAGHGVCVYTQAIAGGPPHRVTPELQFIGMLRPHFAVSGDANTIAAIPAGSARIHLFDRTGQDLGELRGSNEPEIPVAFAEDGRVLVGPLQGTWPIPFFLIDPKTGRRQLWKQLAPLDRTGIRADWDLAVTPDLKYYAYSLTQATSELYVLEGLR